MSAHSLIRNGPTSRTYALDTSFKSYISGLEGKIFYWITIPNTVGWSPTSHSSISSDADRLVSLRAHRVNARGPIRLVPSVESRPWIYGSTYWCPTCKMVKKCWWQTAQKQDLGVATNSRKTCVTESRWWLKSITQPHYSGPKNCARDRCLVSSTHTLHFHH